MKPASGMCDGQQEPGGDGVWPKAGQMAGARIWNWGGHELRQLEPRAGHRRMRQLQPLAVQCGLSAPKLCCRQHNLSIKTITKRVQAGFKRYRVLAAAIQSSLDTKTLLNGCTAVRITIKQLLQTKRVLWSQVVEGTGRCQESKHSCIPHKTAEFHCK